MLKVVIKLLSIVFLYFTLTFYISLQDQTYAQVFEDNFESGNTQWAVINGTWNISEIQDSKRYGSVYGGCCVETVAGDSSWDNYTYEFELLGLQGVDKNAMFRYTASNSKYGIHLTTTDISLEKHTPGSSINLETVPGNFVNNTVYKIKIIAYENNYRLYVNDVLYINFNDNNQPLLNGKIGLRVGAGAVSPSEVWFDNVKVTIITPEPSITATPTATPTSTPTELPTATPTLTPVATSTSTATATATPSYPVLSVPSLKQYSLPWKNRIYDSTNRTIEEFGCALTSASMVLGYHGHNILPDTLNTWLKKQNDGYLRNGLINWLAVSRYTKENDSVSSPTLEYKRLEATNNNLDTELYSGRPAILKEDGHFVVATGKNENTYLINDPGYSDRNTLESYGNSFLAINSYTPTHSDLSYMMFVVDNDVNLTIKDTNGNIIDTVFYLEEPIKSIKNQNRKSGETVKVYLLEKPQLNKYELLLSGPRGQYQLDSYLYNKNGKVTQNELNGRLSGNDIDKYNINFENKLKIKEEENKKDYDKWHKYFFKYFKKWW